MSIFSKNGLKRAILDPLVRGKFFWSKCSSAAKAYTWTNFTQYIRAAVSSVVLKHQRKSLSAPGVSQETKNQGRREDKFPL